MSQRYSRPRIAGTLALLLVLAGSIAQAQPYTILYDAGTNLLPEDSCPAWTLSKTGNTANVASGVLTISGGTQNNVLGYTVPVSFASPVVVEFRARHISGTTSSPAREQLGIGVAPAINLGVHFFVGPDVVFLTNGANSRGPEAFVDTNDFMHTYRIEISGSAVSVFYDNLLVLTGSTFTSIEFPSAEIGWGDITNAADGISEWEYVQHNSSAVRCEPTSNAANTWGRLKTLCR